MINNYIKTAWRNLLKQKLFSSINNKNIKIRKFGNTYTALYFFKIFDFKLKEGDKTKALSKPNGVVVTQSAARHFFGNESPMGKTLRFANGEKFVDCIKDIFRLFSLNITILIGLSILIAAPISYLLMNVWLNFYAFRTNISPWIYVSGFFIALFIVLITIIWQTFLVTVQNPIKSLRTE